MSIYFFLHILRTNVSVIVRSVSHTLHNRDHESDSQPSFKPTTASKSPRFSLRPPHYYVLWPNANFYLGDVITLRKII